jgi:hypothetical protein
VGAELGGLWPKEHATVPAGATDVELARRVQRLSDFLEILRVYYNYIRPHASLSVKRPPRTPAMAAEIFGRRLSFRTIMSWVARPKGRPPCAIRPNGRP